MLTLTLKQNKLLAIAVDAKQGFIKSGFGYYDRENEKQVYDNKTCILNFMQGVDGAEEFTITQDCVEQADKIVDEFKHELIAKKMMGNINDFEGNVLPCCHYGIRLYTNRRNAKDVNNDNVVQETINNFGNDKFNALDLGLETALENCGKFLDSLVPYWETSTPLVCKMICGKK